MPPKKQAVEPSALAQSIAAVHARRGLTPEKRSRAVHDLKAKAIIKALSAGRTRRALTYGDLTLTITRPPKLGTGNDIGYLVFPNIVIRRNGVRLRLHLPLRIRNPPLKVPDGNGGFREDPAEAIRQVILGVVS